MATKLYMVVNLDEAQGHDRHLQCYWLPPGARPSVLHWHRIDAEREAERLATSGKRGTFAVMELVCEVHAGPLMPVGPLVRAPQYVYPDQE
jgi:hypothetical protein